MVLMVPGDDDPLGVEEPGSSRPGEDKAKLDASELDPSEEIPRALQKVELDLDDAPFLEEEEEEEEPEEALDEGAPRELGVEEKKPRFVLPPFLKSKKAVFAILGVLILIIGLILFFALRPKKAPPPEEKKPEVMEQPVTPETPPELKEINVPFAEFWVEKLDDSKKVRFLHIQFSVVVRGPHAEREIKAKTLVLRDAVFYYLRNKDYAFLSDTENLETLKSDLLSVMNKFLGSDQLQVLLIDKYLVQ